MPTQRREEKREGAREREKEHVHGRGEREAPGPLAPLFICFSLPPGPALCKLG